MAKSFGDRLTELLNASAISLAIGVASRTGLLAALEVDSASAAQIATRACLHVRYVEETLAALACGDVVVMTKPEGAAEPLFALPSDRRELLAGMALYFEELPILARCAFEEVTTDAKKGEGVDPSCYGAFGAWMGRLADEKHESTLVQKLLPSLGDDVVRSLESASGAAVLDMGCGEGTAVRLMAKAFPTCRVVGVDICAESVQAAKQRANEEGLSNAEFFVGDVTAVGEDVAPSGTFDLVTAFDVIHDLSNPSGALQEIRRLLKPKQGFFAMVDIRAHTCPCDNLTHSMAPFLYTVSLMHCMPQGLRNGGPGLGMMWGREKALSMLQDAGLKADVLELDFDTFNDCYLCQTLAG